MFFRGGRRRKSRIQAFNSSRNNVCHAEGSCLLADAMADVPYHRRLLAEQHLHHLHVVPHALHFEVIDVPLEAVVRTTEFPLCVVCALSLLCCCSVGPLLLLCCCSVVALLLRGTYDVWGLLRARRPCSVCVVLSSICTIVLGFRTPTVRMRLR